MRKAKKVARFVIELILTVLIVLLSIISIISSTLLNKSYTLSIFEKTDYYNKIYSLVEENFENYIQQSGLNEDVLKNVITKEKIENDTKKIITNIYDDFYEDISTKEIEEKLEQNIKESLGQITLNQSEQKAIKDFINQICDEYKSTISYLNFQKQINEGYNKTAKITKLLKRASIISIGILVIFLIIINIKRVYKIGTNMGISLFSSGIILAIINIYIRINLDIQYITILNNPISDIIRYMVNDIFGNILKYGIISVIIGILLIIIPVFTHYREKYRIGK